jgi:hypothetical protein
VNLESKKLYETVGIYIQSAHEIKLQADILEEYSDSSLDIAFLQIQGDLPKHVAVANLSEKIDFWHTFRSFGFRTEE